MNGISSESKNIWRKVDALVRVKFMMLNVTFNNISSIVIFGDMVVILKYVVLFGDMLVTLLSNT
jgi:hypothetical protein